MNDAMLRSVMRHALGHAIGLPPRHRARVTPLQRQIEQWVKLGAARFDGRPVTFSSSSWSTSEFSPLIKS